MLDPSTKLDWGHRLKPREWRVDDPRTFIDGMAHDDHERDPASPVRATFTVLMSARRGFGPAAALCVDDPSKFAVCQSISEYIPLPLSSCPPYFVLATPHLHHRRL
jgi:hypothetical protein